NLACLLPEPVAHEATGDDRVVMRPDRPDVIPDRVVAGHRGRERADAPATPEVRTRERRGHPRSAFRAGNAAPQGVPGVRRHRIDLALLAVEREGVRPDVVHPERLFETHSQTPGGAFLGS